MAQTSSGVQFHCLQVKAVSFFANSVKNLRMESEFEAILKRLCETSFGRRSFLASIPLLLSACASAPKSEDTTKITADDEKILTKEILPEVRRNYPACKDAEIQNYIANLGSQLIKVNELTSSPYDYSFVVVDVPTINAFALPAGKVFITAPLLASVETEAELAGVLGHEIGHIEAHHAAKRILSQKNSQSKSWWYSTGGLVAGGIVGGVGASILCPGGGSACTQQLVGMAASAGVAAGLLIQKYSFLANSQENELEADRTGFRVSQQAGYSVDHIGDFYRRQQKIWDKHQAQKTTVENSLLDSLSTHPPSLVRVQQMDKLVSQVTDKQPGVVSSKVFDLIRKRAISLGSNGRA